MFDRYKSVRKTYNRVAFSRCKILINHIFLVSLCVQNCKQLSFLIDK